MVADALSREERLKMLISSKELIQELELMELEVKISDEGMKGLFEIQIQPELIEKIKFCQQKVMREKDKTTTGKEQRCEKVEEKMLRFSSRIWTPNV